MAPKEPETIHLDTKIIQTDLEEEERKQLRKEFHHIDEKYTKTILEPFEYYKQLPSKNIRRKIADIFNYWYKCSDKELDRASNGMSELHNASLM